MLYRSMASNSGIIQMKVGTVMSHVRGVGKGGGLLMNEDDNGYFPWSVLDGFFPTMGHNPCFLIFDRFCIQSY